MHVECNHYVDASEPDSRGMYAYYYEYDLFSFSEADVVVVARSYHDTPKEAHFLRIEIDGSSRLMQKLDFQRPLVVAAIQHLHALGKQELNWLSGRGNGYDPVR